MARTILVGVFNEDDNMRDCNGALMNRDLYMPDLANALKAHAGEKYRPSNGSEGDMFFSLWCEHCVKDTDENCPIVAASFVFDVDDPEYPREWQYGGDGQPTCMAFAAIEEKENS